MKPIPDLGIYFLANLKTNVLMWLLGVLFIIIYLSYIWKKRRLYYHAWKLPGPIAFPSIGNAYFLLTSPKDSYATISRIFAKYSPICRVWMDALYVSSSRPQDLEIVLTRCLERGNFFSLTDDVLKDTTLTASIPMWKKQRKILNEVLKPKFLHTFVSIFLREAKELCDNLEENVPVDIFLKIFLSATNASFETLTGVHPQVLPKKKQFLLNTLRYEELLVQRYTNPLLQLNFFFKFSSIKKELDEILQMFGFLREKIFAENRQMAEKMKSENTEEQFLFNNRFLTYIIDNNKENQFPHDLLLRIALSIIPIASETSGGLLSSVLIMLGMHQEIQDKAIQELSTIFGDSTRDPTVEDLNRMGYLERVVKETNRLLPTIPILLREIDQDVELDSYVLAKETRFVVVMEHLHRNPEFWPDPLKFDPDRFLPERSENRPRCAYIPFGVGSRNCPGSKYAMLSVKIFLATILRRYKVSETLDYKNVKEIGIIFSIIAKANKGYRIILERRIE